MQEFPAIDVFIFATNLVESLGVKIDHAKLHENLAAAARRELT